MGFASVLTNSDVTLSVRDIFNHSVGTSERMGKCGFEQLSYKKRLIATNVQSFSSKEASNSIYRL